MDFRDDIKLFLDSPDRDVYFSGAYNNFCMIYRIIICCDLINIPRMVG